MTDRVRVTKVLTYLLPEVDERLDAYETTDAQECMEFDRNNIDFEVIEDLAASSGTVEYTWELERDIQQ